jgi:PAS domain-containing protein
VFLGVVMALYWGTQRTRPGFGLWTVSAVLGAVACILLIARAACPEFVTTMVIPGVLIVGTVLRLEGLRRFLGRPTFDYRTLLLPVVALALLAMFAYAREDRFAQVLVTAAAMAAIYWAMVVVAMTRTEERRRLLRMAIGGLCLVYGMLLLGYGISWMARSDEHPLDEIGLSNLLFFVLAVLFEIGWAAACLTLDSMLTADAREAAYSVTESERSRLAEIVACLPDATWATDGERRVIAWNRAAEALTLVPAGDVVGKSYDDGARAALGGGGP